MFIKKIIRKIRYLVSIAYMHRVGIIRALRYPKKGLKLNIGCGDRYKNGWVNIDLNNKADLTLDARKPFPFADNSCSYVYNEHFLEHLEYPNEASLFLKECYRVLELQGTIRIGVPDTEWPIQAYINDTKGYFKIAKTQMHPASCVTKMEHLNYHFRQNGEHKFAYDYETLVRILTQSGFNNVKKCFFNKTIDSLHRKIGTLYVEAVKY